jgi:DNA-binding transcriptional regulator GbsR (MarR family)
MVELNRGRPAKYIRQKKISNPPEPLFEDRWKVFLDTLKGPGKGQSKELLQFLSEKEKVSQGKGILYLEILTHMKRQFSISRSRVDTLMKELEKWQIVKKKKIIIPSKNTTNKYRIFYQICGIAVTPVITSERMAKDYPRLRRENSELKNNLDLAKSILESHDLIEEYNSEMEKRKVSKEKKRHQTREERIGKITHQTPEEVQKRDIDLENARKTIFIADLDNLRSEK